MNRERVMELILQTDMPLHMDLDRLSDEEIIEIGNTLEVLDEELLSDCMRMLEKDLVSKYSDCKFLARISKNEIEILYDNKKYLNDNDFLEGVSSVASGFLTEDQQWSLTITYDLFNEIEDFLVNDGLED